MVVNGRFLAGAPHKADHGKAFLRTAIQQVLLIELRMGLSVFRGQPIVLGHQFAQQNAALPQDILLAYSGAGGQFIHPLDKALKTGVHKGMSP